MIRWFQINTKQIINNNNNNNKKQLVNDYYGFIY